MKATYVEKEEAKPKFPGDDNTEIYGYEIFKDPITDDGTKRSKKGLLQVLKKNGKIIVKDQCTEKEENSGLLTTVFKDGELVRKITLEEIRNRLSI